MQNYLVMALLGHGDDYYRDVNSFLVTLLHNEESKVIVVGEAEDYLDSLSRTGDPACFTALVSSFSDLKRETESAEQVIGFSVGTRNIFDTAADICTSFNCMGLLSLGPDSEDLPKYFETDNVILKLQISDKGRKIICCPAVKEYSYEVLVDQLFRVDSLTHGSFFEHEKPMVFLNDIFGPTLCEQVVDIAGATKIKLVSTDAEEAQHHLDDYRCFLSAHGLPEETNVTIYYGLGFEYACILHDFKESYYNVLDNADFERAGEW